MFLVNRKTSKRLSSSVEKFAFNDLAHYYEPDDLTSLDEYGHPTDQSSYEQIACSFSDNVQNRVTIERWANLGDISELSAEVRFTGHIVPHKGSRFTLVKKFGIALNSPETYEVIGIRDRGSFGYICALRKVEL